MKIYYSEKFVRKSLMPLLEEIFTDMAAPWGQENKGAYLKKLLIPSPLTAAEKEHFRWDYFDPKMVPAERPFTDATDQDAHQRELFLHLLSETFTTRIKLFGRHNIQERLFPNDDRSYDANSELRDTVYRLAYRIMHHFEEEQLHSMVPTTNEDDVAQQKQENQIQNGQTKILQLDIDGVAQEYVIQDNELDTLKKNLPADQTTKDTVNTLENEFRITKQISIEEMMEEHGLEIVEPVALWSNGTATAVVQDVSGQRLQVSINLGAPEDDAHKYTFTFQGKAADNKPNRSGTSFSLSQNDLKKFFLDKQGKPRTAEDVLQDKFGFSPFKPPEDFLLPSEKLPPLLPQQEMLPKDNNGAPALTWSGKLPHRLPDIELETRTKSSMTMPSSPTEKREIERAKAQTKGKILVMSKSPSIPSTPKTTVDLFNVAANKMRLQQQRQQQLSILGQQQARGAQAAKARANQQKKMSAGAKMAIGAGAASGGAFGTILWAAIHTATSKPDAIKSFVETAQWCWQHICFG